MTDKPFDQDADRRLSVPTEIFNGLQMEGATTTWPRPRPEPGREQTHPAIIPDLREGPFRWLGEDTDEIGYEGQR
jgi:hypothetical protein